MSNENRDLMDNFIQRPLIPTFPTLEGLQGYGNTTQTMDVLVLSLRINRVVFST